MWFVLSISQKLQEPQQGAEEQEQGAAPNFADQLHQAGVEVSDNNALCRPFDLITFVLVLLLAIVRNFA